MVAGLKSVIIKFTIFGVISALLFWILLNTILNPVKGDTDTYYAKFSNVSGLRVGDDIKVAGVRVGRVADINVDEENGKYVGAVVKLQMDKSEPIPTNAKLIMRYQNLIGQRYLSIQFPDGVKPADTTVPAKGFISNAACNATDKLPEGTPVCNTDRGFDLTELLNGFQPLFSVLKPEDVNTLSTTLIKVLQGEGPTVNSLLEQTAQLTSYVGNRDEVIGSVLTNLTPVLQDFAAHSTDLRTTVVSLKDMFTTLATDRQQLGGAITALSNLVVTSNGLLTQVKAPLEKTVTTLRQAADMLAASRDKLGAAVTSFPLAIGALGRATSYENALNIYVCSLSIQLAGPPAVNPGNPANNSAVCK